MYPDPSFWRGKRVLLTGHTGFKGAWLALWLQRLGAHVTGLALAPATRPALFDLACVAQGMDSQYLDIRDAAAVAAAVRAAQPDVLLHLAAQALVMALNGSGFLTLTLSCRLLVELTRTQIGQQTCFFDGAFKATHRHFKRFVLFYTN